ncbi:MAG: YlbF family regulator [Bacilli bacterium]|nr:YlbF family regulator [Bacilli bacterium]
MEELNKIIEYITSTDSYKNTVKLKEQMSENTELTDLIEEVKSLQKEYIKTNSTDIKKKLDEKTSKLEEYPIYNSYNKYLEEVNHMISYVNDELNDYFDKVINESN